MPLAQRPARSVTLTTLQTDVDDEPLTIVLAGPTLAFRADDERALAAAQHFAQLAYAPTAAALKEKSASIVGCAAAVPDWPAARAESLSVVVNGAPLTFELGKSVWFSTADMLAATKK